MKRRKNKTIISKEQYENGDQKKKIKEMKCEQIGRRE